MNIWIIQLEEPLPFKDEAVVKMRTGMLCEKLLEAGHSVLWWTSAFSHYNKTWLFHEDTQERINERLSIYALKTIGYKKNISLARYISLRLIARKFGKIAPRMPRPDIIVASFPPYDLS